MAFYKGCLNTISISIKIDISFDQSTTNNKTSVNINAWNCGKVSVKEKQKLLRLFNQKWMICGFCALFGENR